MVAPQYPTIPIGLWGATQSGKTTFLGALRLASLRDQPGAAQWQLIGDDDYSDDWLIERTNELERHEFPPPTVLAERVRCIFNGNLGHSPWARFTRGLGAGDNNVAFTLDVIDAPGLLHSSTIRADDTELNTMIDHLVSCRGIIFLYDPTRADNFDFMQRTLSRLARRSIAAGTTIEGGKLPHYVAACMTKFDDPRVFEEARSTIGLVRDPNLGNILTVRDAKEFFLKKAPDTVRNSLRNFFSEKRVRYFAISAIGFNTDVHGRVIENDYANSRTGADDVTVIRSTVRPVNTLEPLIWLERTIRVADRPAANAQPWRPR